MSRIVAVAGMVASVAIDASRACLSLALWAIVSDIADGRLARRLGVATPAGARLDSIADCALYLTAPWIALALFPWLRDNETGIVIAIFVACAVPVLYGLLKFGRLTSYHTTAARVGALCVVVGMAATVVTHTAWPLQLGTTLLVVSALEEMAITWTCAEWRADVRSLFDVLRVWPGTVVVHHFNEEVPMQASRRRSTGVRWSPVVLLVALAVAAPRHAAAQVSVGGYLGAEFDNKEDWLLFGGEARLPLSRSATRPWDGQVRLSYHPYGTDVSSLQVDANALMPLVLAQPMRFKPYIGVGGALVHASFPKDSENKIGLNLITGATMDVSATSPVYALLHTQYTLTPDYPNSYTLTVGVGAHLGGKTPGGGATPPTRR
jgi:CDP-diacylglycerol--glycerol-3-phosphate 3-phosphatidyltransferase